MNRKAVLIALSASLVCGMTAVFAQDLEGFDPKAIEARADELKADAQALFDYATVNAQDHQAEAQSVVEDGYRSVEGLEVGDLPGENGPVDFDEMIADAKAGMAQPKGAPLFVAFASLSMPEDALAQMIADTFITGIRKVVDQRGASNIAIDPRLFRAFNVDRVPTYVALSTDFEPCDQLECVSTPPPHDRIAGNVSVAYVLETFAEANGPGAPVARLGLANIRGQR